MKIIQTIGWIAPRYGGPAIHVPQLARALAQRGHEVILITTNADGPHVLSADQIPSVDDAGYTTIACGRDRPRWYLTSRELSAALRQHLRDADILHVHCMYRFHTRASRKMCIQFGVPYVLSPHGALDDYQRKQHRLRKAVYHRLAEDENIRNAALMQYASEVEKAQVEACGYGVPGVVIPNGIDVAALQTVADPSLLPLAVRRGHGPIIFFVGRLAAKKGIPRLIEALAIVRSSVPDARLVVAGPDESGLGLALRALAGRLGIADAVVLTGPVHGQEKVALYQHARVFGLPSDDENFGIVVAEAMAAGTPVVISKHVALHGLVTEWNAGSVVGVDPTELAAGLLPYLQDPQMARERGVNAAAAACQSFSWDALAGRFEEMYMDVASGPRVRP